jgi:hypothetical protein
MRKPFLRFLLSFFINYVAISAFYLRGKSFKEDRNHHQYTIETALITVGALLDLFWAEEEVIVGSYFNSLLVGTHEPI